MQSGGLLFTGRLSRRAQPWLADHEVGGEAVVPGAAFVELALYAAARSDCAGVRELVLHTPVALPPDGAVQLQLAVGAPAADGVRTLEVYGRGADAGPAAPWQRYATGALGAPDEAEAAPAGRWPPEGAEPLALDGLDDRFADAGVRYGPSFRGLRAVWRRGDEELFAEVSLPRRPAAQAGDFGLHPALLDAALQPLALALTDTGRAAPRPFSWHDITLHAPGRGTVRAALRLTGADRVAVRLTDEDGRPVATLGSMVLRTGAGASGPAAGPVTAPAVRLSPGTEPFGGSGALSAGRPEPVAEPREQWSARLAGHDEAEQLRLLQNLVRGQAAAVLGHPDPGGVPADRAFREIGFESVTAVELCNRLNSATGVRLPAVTVFDHPTPELLARRLRQELSVADSDSGARLAARIDELEAALAGAEGDALTRATARLRQLLWKLGDTAAEPAVHPADGGDAGPEDFSTVSDLDMFALIDSEFGPA
ncbi:polyketide synthase dehydratase domain-containing protein [Streptomyces collinus]|uniref:polyketide synthase dehydratase domain-containing protein n=1 Tax=Streptomyces collinus TaxID=42684 RepID=UPI0036A40F3B